MLKLCLSFENLNCAALPDRFTGSGYRSSGLEFRVFESAGIDSWLRSYFIITNLQNIDLSI